MKEIPTTQKTVEVCTLCGAVTATPHADATCPSGSERLATARQLARAHREHDPKVRRIYWAKWNQSNPGPKSIRLLEVTGSVGTTNAIIPFGFAARPDLGVYHSMSVALISDEEYEALQNGGLDLPDGWGSFHDLQEIAEEEK